MTINKEDLVFTHYIWRDEVAEERQDLSPTRRIFDRENGLHVLWIANWYATQYEQFQKNDLSKLETMISDELPFSKLSERSVSEWLVNTWR